MATKKDFSHQQLHKIRITLTSRKVKALEKACDDLIRGAKQKKITKYGPRRLPTKVLHLCVRKSPCGEGTNTWDNYEMRIHKRVIDFKAADIQVVKQITSINLDPGVEVEIYMDNDSRKGRR